MRQHTIKLIYIFCGWFALLLGVIGIFLPLLPTTPFVLLAAFCFSRSSERFHQWLLNHHFFGPIVKAWEEGKGIPKQARNFALLLMWSGMSLSMFVVGTWWSIAILVPIGIGVSIYLLRLPSY